MSLISVPGESWQSRAACTGKEARAFHSASPARAKEICRPCPVRAECLHDALTTKAPSGVWGGLTPDERRLIPALPAPASVAITALREVLAAYDAAHTPTPAPPTATVQRGARAVPQTKASRARKPATKTAKPAGKKKPKATARTAKTGPTPAERQAAERAERRAKVAEMLREGATQRQIRDAVGVCGRTVASVREEYGLPGPTGSGRRYSPEERAELERRAIPLLQAGATYKQIKDAIGISAPMVIAIRRKAGIPKPDPTRFAPAPRSTAEGLALYLEPHDGDHVRWTGPTRGRTALLWAEGRRFNVRHVIFEQHHGRPPVGYVRRNCKDEACVAGAHLIDDVLSDNFHSQTEEPAMATAPSTQPAVRIAPVRAVPATAADADRAPAKDLPVDELLDWADSHEDADVQATAQRTRAALVGLRNRYDADRELSDLDTEAEQLEQRLAELRARRQELAPAKAKKPKGTRNPDATAARAWAKENGVDCPPVGRVPAAVMDAWRQATGAAS